MARVRRGGDWRGAAIELGGVSYVLPIESIAPALRRLVTLGVGASLAERYSGTA